MKEVLQRELMRFVNNTEAIRRNFRWDSEYMYPLCALIYAAKGKDIDVDRLKEAKDILNKEYGAFSAFRSTQRMALIAQMAASSDMKGYLDQVSEINNLLNGNKLFNSEYRIIAAMVIAGAEKNPMITNQMYVDKTLDLYQRMKKNHPWLTSSEDMSFAAMLAVTDLDSEMVEKEMEACYQLMKSFHKFPSSNGLQSLSHVLSLELGNSQEKCQKVFDLYTGLKERKKRYGTYYELSSLGALAIADVDPQILIEEIVEVDDYLKQVKGFGAWGIGSQQRLMYSAMLVMQQYVDAKVQLETASTLSGVVSLIIAQQAALLAAISAANASAAAASN